MLSYHHMQIGDKTGIGRQIISHPPLLLFNTEKNLARHYGPTHSDGTGFDVYFAITIGMKKTPINQKPETPSPLSETDKKIFEELEISQRTQLPPTEEEIARLNEIASKPPFSYIHKVRGRKPH
jgi:hypothetical protein